MATTTVSKINIKLSAQTAELESGFARGTRATQTFAGNVAQASTKVSTASAAMGSAVSSAASAIGNFAKGAAIAAGLMAVHASIQAVKNSFGELDAVAKTAAATDFSAESIVAWGRAADEAGADMETFTKGIQRLTRMEGDAIAGNEAAIKAFEAVGLTLEELQQLSPEEVFKEVAEAISLMPTAAEKAAAATDLFGKSSEKLIHTLNLGEAGLEAYSKQAEQLNLGVNDEQLKSIEAANDSMSTFWATVKGAFNQIAAALAPAIAEHFGNLTTLAADFSRLVEEWAPAITGFADVWVDHFAEIIDSLRLGIQNAMEFSIYLREAFGDDVIERIGRTVGEVTVLVDKLLQIPRTILMAMSGGAEPAEKLAEAVKKAATDTEELDEAMQNAGKATEKVDDKVSELAKAGERLTEAMKTPFEQVADDLQRAQELLDAGVISWQTYMRAIGEADASLQDLTKTKAEAEVETNVGFVDRNTQAGYAAMFARESKTDNEKVVEAITTGDAAIVATLRDVIRAAKEGGVTIVKRPLS